MRKGGFLAAVFGGLLLVFLISLASLRLFGASKQDALTEKPQEDIWENGADEEWGEKEEAQDKIGEENSREENGSAAEETSVTLFAETGEEEVVATGNMITGNEVSGNEITENRTLQDEISQNDVPENRIPAETLLRRKKRTVSGKDGFGNSISGNSISGNDISGNSISENGISPNRILGANISESDFSKNAISENSISESGISQNTASENRTSENREAGSTISGNTISGSTTSGNMALERTTSGNTVSGSVTSANMESGRTTSGNTVSGSLISGNMVSGNRASGDKASENSVSENAVSGNGISGNTVARSLSENAVMTLAQRQKARSSHKETLLANTQDRATISGNCLDFSNIKIACLGDSITEASNLERLENYKELSYPAALEKALGAQEVYNLGIGGSSIGRYWADAFVDRYQEIPQDTDLILVMGGTNDGFCASMVEFGTPTERKSRTFWGDLDELMDGLAADYPYAEVIFLTPLPNGLHDYLKKEHPYLISQEKYAQVISQLAAEHGMEVIDLYNSNILDGHDKDNALHLMPDSVHPNVEGYRILGEHVAAEIIRLLEERHVSGTD